MVKRETKDYLVSQVSVFLEFQENRVRQVRQDFQGPVETRVRRVRKECLANLALMDQRVTKEALGTQVSQAGLERRVYLDFLDLLENLAAMAVLAKLDYKDLKVPVEIRGRLERMAFLDPLGREETQVYQVWVCLGHLELWAKRVKKVIRVSLACLVNQVFLVSEEKRDFLVLRDPKGSQENKVFQAFLLRAPKESLEREEQSEKEVTQEYQDVLECQAGMARRERKVMLVLLVSKESQDRRVTLELLDSLAQQASRVSTGPRESEDCRVFLDSQVPKVLWVRSDSKEKRVTEDSLEKKATKVPLVPPVHGSQSKETSDTQEIRDFLALRGHRGFLDRKDSKV